MAKEIDPYVCRGCMKILNIIFGNEITQSGKTEGEKRNASSYYGLEARIAFPARDEGPIQVMLFNFHVLKRSGNYQ